MALNHGVVAHEHFHAHFQSQVIQFLDEALNKNDSFNTFFSPIYFFSGQGHPTVTNLDGWDMRTPLGLNNFILRGWNEGLADFFASIYTGQPDFFAASLPVEAHGRDVSLPVARLPTAFEFTELSKRPDFKSQVYGQGAFLARLMYRLAYSGSEPAERTLERVLKNLNRLPKQILPDYQRRVLEFDEIVPALLSGFRPNQKGCATLQLGLSEQLVQKNFPECGI